MSLTSSINSIKRILNGSSTDSDKLNAIKYHLPEIDNFGYKRSKKELLLDVAKNSNYTKFRLLSNINESNNIFMWCNSEYNFIGLCQHKLSEEYVVDYDLDELPVIIENAEKWLFGVSKIAPHYQYIDLEIMGV